MYIGCDKSKTYFDIENFITETALEVPMNILVEIATPNYKQG